MLLGWRSLSVVDGRWSVRGPLDGLRSCTVRVFAAGYFLFRSICLISDSGILAGPNCVGEIREEKRENDRGRRRLEVEDLHLAARECFAGLDGGRARLWLTASEENLRAA